MPLHPHPPTTAVTLLHSLLNQRQNEYISGLGSLTHLCIDFGSLLALSLLRCACEDSVDEEEDEAAKADEGKAGMGGEGMVSSVPAPVSAAALDASNLSYPPPAPWPDRLTWGIARSSWVSCTPPTPRGTGPEEEDPIKSSCVPVLELVTAEALLALVLALAVPAPSPALEAASVLSARAALSCRVSSSSVGPPRPGTDSDSCTSAGSILLTLINFWISSPCSVCVERGRERIE